MANTYGNDYKITIFGQSHSNAIGVVIEGLKAGEKIDLDDVQSFVDRRAPGKNEFSTKRAEKDKIEILSGIVDGISCGTPITAVIYNKDFKSNDYKNLAGKPRPSHSDFAAFYKYNNYNDKSGGGHFSGRLTAPMCIAGAIAIQKLEEMGIKVFAHIKSIGNIEDEKFDNIQPDLDFLSKLDKSDFPVIDESKADLMKKKILEAKADLDSIGGKIECMVCGLPIGLGEHIFDGLENRISQIIFGIPAIKGIEFGNGFECANLLGSQNNDEFYYDENGKVKTKTNNCGGILGGMSNGMPLNFVVAIKPTPSIAKEQNTVNLQTKQNEKLTIIGRHDPCIVQRAIPCVQAATAIAIYDLILGNK